MQLWCFTFSLLRDLSKVWYKFIIYCTHRKCRMPDALREDTFGEHVQRAIRLTTPETFEWLTKLQDKDKDKDKDKGNTLKEQSHWLPVFFRKVCFLDNRCCSSACRSGAVASISINLQDGAGCAGQDHQDVAPLRLLPPSQRGTSPIITKLTSLWHN